MKSLPSIPGLWAAVVFGLLLPVTVSFGALQEVSVIGPFLSAPSGGNGDSGAPIVSPDGRYVLFASTANNLALAGTNTLPGLIPPYFNVYLRDRLNGTTTLVSVNMAGTGGGDGNSFPTGLSTNGQFALFESSADNLALNDNNNTNDVFLRDVVNGITSLVSVTPSGGSGNGGSRGSTLTPDGRYVAFFSAAANLVANDTNGIPDVFVRDMQAGTTTLVSVGAMNAQNLANLSGFPASSSEAPEITPDGRYVAFLSSATNLMPGVTNIGEVYVRNMVNGTTTWASTNAQILSHLYGAGFCYNQAISDDGQYVAFEISLNLDSTSSGCILRNKLQTGLTDIVATNAAVPFGPYQDKRSLNLTPDGQTIVYAATNGSASVVYLWNAQSGTNILVSVNATNGVTPGAAVDWPDLDTSGRYVVFYDTDPDLTGTTNGGDVFIRDMQAGTTTLASVDTNGLSLLVDPGAAPAFSASGQFIAFESPHANLDGRNFYSDLFIRNLTNNASEMISDFAPSLPSFSPNGPSQVWPGSISTDSQYIAFSSWANNLGPNDNSSNLSVFVRNLIWETNILASVASNGVAANGMSTEPAISGNGRYVAFASFATNLVAGDPGLFWQIYVRDLQGGSNILVSVSTNGGFGNGDSTLPSISTDGRYVLFWSAAQNLTSSTSSNLFVRDLEVSQTYALDAVLYGPYAVTPDGRYVTYIGSAGSTTALYVWSAQAVSVIYTNAASITNIAISPDGAWVAYTSSNSLYAGNVIAQTNCLIAPGPFNNHAVFQFSADDRFLVYSTLGAVLPNDTNTGSDVYLYDFQAGTNLLISQSTSQTAGNGDSDSAAISPDGRFIAYRSSATNLVPNDTNTVPELFLYDRVTQTNTLVSAGLDGGAGNNRSLTPYFSADSQTLIFESWASDLVPQDFNSGGNVFALDLYSIEMADGTTNSSSALQPEIIFQGPSGMVPGASLVVTWPFASGTSYSVQYKNNLTDQIWLNLNGTVTEIGNRAYITDFSPPPGRRFYRIVQNN